MPTGSITCNVGASIAFALINQRTAVNEIVLTDIIATDDFTPDPCDPVKELDSLIGALEITCDYYIPLISHIAPLYSHINLSYHFIYYTLKAVDSVLFHCIRQIAYDIS